MTTQRGEICTYSCRICDKTRKYKGRQEKVFTGFTCKEVNDKSTTIPMWYCGLEYSRIST